MELLVYPAVYLLWRKRELPPEEQEQTALLSRWHKLAMGGGVAVAIFIAAAMVVAGGDEAQPLYPRYDAVRLALVNQSLPEAKARANDLALMARVEDHEAIASRADGVAQAPDVERARHAFAELTDAMLAYRDTAREEPKPVVAYCSMAKRSWLQPKGKIGNPYLDASMRECGQIQQP
jgi:hypothetical protein